MRRKPTFEGNPKAKVWEIGTHEAKDVIYQRLDRDNVTADGYMHFPQMGCYGEAFFRMLIAENSSMERANDGKFYRKFICEEGIRNEALDIRVMAVAVERIRKPNYTALALEYAVKEEKPKDAAAGISAAPAPPPAPSLHRRAMPGRGFVTGGSGGWWR